MQMQMPHFLFKLVAQQDMERGEGRGIGRKGDKGTTGTSVLLIAAGAYIWPAATYGRI